MAFCPFFAFAFTLGPLLAISVQVARFFAVKPLLFLDEFQAFFVCQPLCLCCIQLHRVIGARISIIGWLLAFACVLGHISQTSATPMFLGLC
jgi:hypothetical protein